MICILYARCIPKDNSTFFIAVTPEEALAPTPVRTQVVPKPETVPSATKSEPPHSLQSAPVFVPLRPPPKVPTAKKPVPSQRMGGKPGHVSLLM